MVSLIQLHHSSSLQRLQRCQGTTAWGRSPRPRRYSARCPSISPPFGGRKGVREPPGAMVQSLGETLWKPWNCRLNLMIWLMSHDNPMIGPQYVQSKKLSMNNEHDLSIYVYNIYIHIWWMFRISTVSIYIYVNVQPTQIWGRKLTEPWTNQKSSRSGTSNKDEGISGHVLAAFRNWTWKIQIHRCLARWSSDRFGYIWVSWKMHSIHGLSDLAGWPSEPEDHSLP